MWCFKVGQLSARFKERSRTGLVFESLCLKQNAILKETPRKEASLALSIGMK